MCLVRESCSVMCVLIVRNGESARRMGWSVITASHHRPDVSHSSNMTWEYNCFHLTPVYIPQHLAVLSP